MADDWFFYTQGQNHMSKVKQGMELSLDFFKDIGAKVAQNKCFLTSTDNKTREELRNSLFGEEGQNIQVINHFRDLGSHVCMDQTKLPRRSMTGLRKLFSESAALNGSKSQEPERSASSSPISFKQDYTGQKLQEPAKR